MNNPWSEADELRKRAALLRQAEVDRQMPGDVLVGLDELLDRAAVTIAKAEQQERAGAEIASALDAMKSWSHGVDITGMQRQHEDRLRAATRHIIAETDEGFEVHEWTETGVAPWAIYPTRQAAAARLLQLLGINHAVIPQSWPESVCIGSVITEKDTP